PRAAALEAEQRDDRGGPLLGRCVDAGVERVRLLDLRCEVVAELVEPGAGEDPVAGALDAVRLAEMPERGRTGRLVNRRADVAALDQFEARRVEAPGRRG